MYAVSVILGQLPARVWLDVDFSDLDAVVGAQRFLNGVAEPTMRADALDRELIAEAKAREARSLGTPQTRGG